jgi:predicted RNA-binding Zn ribbon-like protein
MTILNTEPDGVANIALVGGALCLDFANTRSNVDRDTAPDELVSYGEWLDWAERTGVVSGDEVRTLREKAAGDPGEEARELARVKAVRDVVFRIFRAVADDSLPDPGDLDRLRETWTSAVGAARLGPGEDGFGWDWSENAADLSRPLWPVVESAVTLLSSGELGRIKFCGGNDCSWLFLDQSKNGRRRWCQMDVCGNREKARRHYRKKKDAAGPRE